MATYSKLLLSTGGGIISIGQQAQQTEDTASILIGLGGTGVHCIRTIKTQVYNRLKPDASNASIPSYPHIRFLGIDSDDGSKEGKLREKERDSTDSQRGQENQPLPLTDAEFFPIGTSNLRRAFDSPVLKDRRDLSWLQYDKVPIPDLGTAGAGGIRQIGRYMLMDKFDTFIIRLQNEIRNARTNLNTPQVNIHIFSGLGGGTGSGCFLDVCYIAHYITESMNIPNVTIFGYFFLPDVNLSKIPLEDVSRQATIRKNGYAAMQELDYCMNLQYNGGKFVQEYKGGILIPWNRPPVDMCHLICATDTTGDEIPNAYNYAMNVTAEYIMDFLTASNNEFNLTSHLANFRDTIRETDNRKVRGSQMAYCVIGASCANVPLREINTYLASELFSRFSKIKENKPSETDIENLAIAALAPSAQTQKDIYESLLREIQSGTPFSYSPFPGDWKEIRDSNNGNMVEHYTNQTAAKKRGYTTNASSMTDQNENSLISRVRRALQNVIIDIDRGSMFAYRMLSAAEDYNLSNLINGLIEENKARLEQEKLQDGIRQQDYENAWSDFWNNCHNMITIGNSRRFQVYEYYLMIHEQHELIKDVYTKLGTVLQTFKEQVTAISGEYLKLSRVMMNLMETFEENQRNLSNTSTTSQNQVFSTPMMTIEDLRESLDEEIDKFSIPNMLDNFMLMLLNNKEEWIAEDENRITKLVTDFFFTAFSDFANRTITRFLRDKYQKQTGNSISDGELTNYILNQWIVPLTNKARPLFYFNDSIWSETNTSRLAFLSYPATSAPIQAAAAQMNEQNPLWNLKQSALTDRIFVMSCASGLPLSAYNNSQEYERAFYSSNDPGRHYYEGKPENMNFSNWNLLPPFMPQSAIDTTRRDFPIELNKILEKAWKLYDEVQKYGILDDNSRFCRPTEGAMEKLEEACVACENVISESLHTDALDSLEKMKNSVTQAMQIPMIPTEIVLPQDGNRNDRDAVARIQKDHFVASPVYHEWIAKIIHDMKALLERADKAVMMIEWKKAEIPCRDAVEQIDARYKECKEMTTALADSGEFKELDKALNSLQEMTIPALPEEPVFAASQGDTNIEYIRTTTLTLKSKIDKLQNSITKIVKTAQEKKQDIEDKESASRAQNKLFDDYCNALFTGVITLEGRVISYLPTTGHKAITLSEIGDAFPYGSIPYFQAFLSYQNLNERWKKEIVTEYRDRLNKFTPEVKETADRLTEEVFNERKRKAWIGRSEQLEDSDRQAKEQDICGFMEKLFKAFDIFCGTNF